MLVVVVVFLTGSFYFSGLLFPATSTPPRLLRPAKASTGSEVYPGYFQLLYFCQAFPPQYYLERYGFEGTFFTHRRFLPYAPLPIFLARFCDSDAGRIETQMQAGTPPPGSSSVPALTGLTLPAGAWT